MSADPPTQPLMTTGWPHTPALLILDELGRCTSVSCTRPLKELFSNAWEALAAAIRWTEWNGRLGRSGPRPVGLSRLR
jgi:hypothetical protein